LSQVSATIHRPARRAGSEGAALPDLQLQHLPGAHHRHFQLRWWPLLDLAASISCGAAINVFNFSGGHSQTLQPAPPGARHRRLQLRWWPLPDLAASTPRARHQCLQLWRWALLDLAASTPQGARHRRLQLRWWPLTDPAASIPPGGPPSTSPTWVVAATGPCR
jgi:hypothetical protein